MRSTVGGAAGGDAAAILRAKDKAALEHVRHNGNALGVFQNFFRNAFVRRGHDLVQHAACMIQPVVGCFATGSAQAMLDKLRTATNVITFFKGVHLFFYLCEACLV